MKRLLFSLLKLLLFWLVFFNLGRLFFVLKLHSFFRIEEVPLAELFSVPFYALKLDISTACYLLAPAFVILLLYQLFPRSLLIQLFRFYHYSLIILLALVLNAEIGIYPEWKSKMDYKALHYLRHPEEVAQSSNVGDFWLLLFLVFLLSFIFIYLFNRYIRIPLSQKNNVDRKWLISLILIPIFLFLGMRGGMQPIPINQSQSYFSNYNIVNLVTVNPLYNLVHSIRESLSFQSENPFPFYPLEEARQTVQQLHRVEKDTTEKILNMQRPNIVMLILESWSADLIESLGGEAGITPEFRLIEQEGILFTGLYSSGNRTQQGMASIYGGFPALPLTTISSHYSKFIKLPSLTRVLGEAGYSTSFIFGGQLIYGGLRAYIMYNGFDKIIEEKDFSQHIPRGKLGVHDEYTMQYTLQHLNTEKQPFFCSLFTLSSHSPYDQPMKQVLDWGGNENQYINSAFYTDKCLGDFFREAQKQSWYPNTLFVIVADHSHNSYKNHWVDTPPYRRIPLLLAGDVIRQERKGSQVSKIASQTDLATTLLAQLGLDYQAFHWSKNLFNPYTPAFSYFEIQVGCGWIRPDGELVYRKTSGQLELMSFPPEVAATRQREGLSYLQVLFQEFIDF